MTVMLAIPGMPLDKAPILTARQASSLIASLSEPLAQVKVGRLTRRLEHPSKLVPTEERGTLSLWLLPNDEMSFMWHTYQSIGEELDRNNSINNSGGNDVASSSSLAYAKPDIAQPPLSTTPNPTTAPSTSTPSSSTSNPLPFAAPPLPDSVTIATSSLTMWEELAHFPAGYNFIQDDQPLVTIHMLTGDHSGRAFYIKFREDVKAVTNQVERGPGRMYFWLTEPSKSRGIQSLGALKGCWKRPVSLAKRSGVAEKQIEIISKWTQQADVALIRQQQQASFSVNGMSKRSPPITATATNAPEKTLPSRMAASPFMVGLRTPFVHREAAARGGTTGRVNHVAEPSIVAVEQDSAAAAALDAAISSPLPERNAPTEAVKMSSSVSATANAVYQDRRYNVSCPCSISVVANVTVQAPAGATTGGESSSVVNTGILPGLAAQQARQRAEAAARAAVSRIGRLRVEETIADQMFNNVRSQRSERNKNRADRAAKKKLEERTDRAAQVQHLIKQAVEKAVAAGGKPYITCKSALLLATAAMQAVQVRDRQIMDTSYPVVATQIQDPLSLLFNTFPTNNSNNNSIMSEPASPAEMGSHLRAKTSVSPPSQSKVTVDNLRDLLNSTGDTSDRGYGSGSGTGDNDDGRSIDKEGKDDGGGTATEEASSSHLTEAEKQLQEFFKKTLL
jgi:hypothetical protein